MTTALLTVTFIRKGTPTGRDARGNDMFTPVSTDVAGCLFAPATSSEVTLGGDTVTTPATVYAPTGTEVSAIDQIDVPGYGLFEVDGTPEVWPANPFTGWQPPRNVVIRLKQVTG